MEETYCSVFTARYKPSAESLKLFSDREKFTTWRQLWIWLAESEKELGLNITDEQLAELNAQRNNIDWAKAAEHEKTLRHDVMAHVHTYRDACPTAGGILHLGATSAFVQDNTELIIIKKGLELLVPKVARCIDRLSKFALAQKDVITVGRTHYQAASLTTVGKRACLWLQDLLMALERMEYELDRMRFRGVKGATGTKDSFLKLFDGDAAKVEKLNDLVTKKAGFKRSYRITGQTYTRLEDLVVLNALSTLGAAVHKIAMDIRILQSFKELQEPFETNQIGSSAMPHKKNPMRCERVCGFARFLMSLVGNPQQTAAIQGFERTLDDSSNKRLVIPEAFLCADSILQTLQNVFEGLNVNKAVIQKHVDEELPFLSSETILMELVKNNVDRQVGHEKLRQIMLKGSETVMAGGQLTVMDEIKADPFFASVKDRLHELVDAKKCIGLCVEDVEAYVKEEIEPATSKYGAQLEGKSELAV